MAEQTGSRVCSRRSVAVCGLLYFYWIYGSFNFGSSSPLHFPVSFSRFSFPLSPEALSHFLTRIMHEFSSFAFAFEIRLPSHMRGKKREKSGQLSFLSFMKPSSTKTSNLVILSVNSDGPTQGRKEGGTPFIGVAGMAISPTHFVCPRSKKNHRMKEEYLRSKLLLKESSELSVEFPAR